MGTLIISSMLKDLVEKVDNLNEQRGNFGRKMETIKKSKILYLHLSGEWKDSITRGKETIKNSIRDEAFTQGH